MKDERDYPSLEATDLMLKWALNAIGYETGVSVPYGTPTSRKDKGTSISITKIPNDRVKHLYIVGGAQGNPENITDMGEKASLDDQSNPKDDNPQEPTEEEYGDTVVYLGLTNPVKQRSNLKTIMCLLELKLEHDNVYGVASESDAQLLRGIKILNGKAQDADSPVKMITYPISQVLDLANVLYHDANKKCPISENQLVDRLNYVNRAIQYMPDAVKWNGFMMLPYDTLERYEKAMEAQHIPLRWSPLFLEDGAYDTNWIVTTSDSTDEPVKYDKDQGLLAIAPGAVLRLRLEYEQRSDSPKLLNPSHKTICHVYKKSFASVKEALANEEDDTAHALDIGDEEAERMTMKRTKAVTQATVPFE